MRQNVHAACTFNETFTGHALTTNCYIAAPTANNQIRASVATGETHSKKKVSLAMWLSIKKVI
jgi:hypothetical protein